MYIKRDNVRIKRIVLDLRDAVIQYNQKPIRVETCNGPLCAWKQASEYSIC